MYLIVIAYLSPGCLALAPDKDKATTVLRGQKVRHQDHGSNVRTHARIAFVAPDGEVEKVRQPLARRARHYNGA